MAKGSAFLGNVVNKVKSGGKAVLSNLKVDGGVNGVARSVAGKEGYALRQQMNAAGRAMANSGVDQNMVNMARDMKKGANVFYNTHTTKGLYNSYKNTSSLRPTGIGNAAGSKVVGGMAKEYFWDGANKTQRATRIGAAVGAYAGVNGVGRFVTGGNITRNSKGNRDIAGVPFI